VRRATKLRLIARLEVLVVANPHLIWSQNLEQVAVTHRVQWVTTIFKARARARRSAGDSTKQNKQLTTVVKPAELLEIAAAYKKSQLIPYSCR
jgi:hypothetical protein